MDKLGFKLDWIKHSDKIYKLQKSNKPFSLTYKYQNRKYTLDQYYRRNNVLGFLVLKDNQIVLEKYLHNSDINSRFLSYSIQKSITSTLFGIALEDGKIKSIDDPVIKYLPELKVSGYNNVTLRQVLQMSSGIDATEDYLDPHSSIQKFGVSFLRGVPSFMDYLKILKAKPNVVPGTIFDYESVNTEVLGIVIERSTGLPLNKYLQEKLWKKIGTQSDAFIFRAKSQINQCAFGCFNATLRDYGRFGLMMMNGGILGGNNVVDSSWVTQATTQRFAPTGEHLDGYGYQWWIPQGNDHAFEGIGIFGQTLYSNPTKHIVIVKFAAWPTPDSKARWMESERVINAIVKLLS